MNKKYIWIAIIILIVIGGLIILNNTKVPQPATTDTLTTTTKAPVISWVPEIPHLRDRLNSINLPALAQEGTVLHTHQHLDILINGKSKEVPAGIGINPTEGFISPIHTHDTSGVIHVESPKVQDFTLGQFFTIWGLKFTDTCIGEYCKDANNNLVVYVGGKKFSGDPRTIVLTAHQEIAIIYGSGKDTPSVIPSSYVFTAGE